MSRSRPAMNSSRSRRMPDRRGSIMPLFAVLLFALLPLMALIVHTGFITLTRRQMQTAVNTAALEGLRSRDDNSLTEQERRERVRDLVSAVFDDNLDSDSEDALRLGAGPVVEFDDEPTDVPIVGSNFKASRTIRPENLGVYDPDPILALNTSDARDGDMVRGQYVDSASDHEESGTYQRNDFRLPGDSGYDAVKGNDAFLARLRRSGETFAADTGSAGPTIPFLFGRGGLTRTVYDAGATAPHTPHNPDPAALWNRRERGTIVRSTAIAQAQPAKSVGPGFTTPNIEGLTNVVVDSDFWRDAGWSATADPDEFQRTVSVVTNGMTLEIQHNSTTVGRLVVASTEVLTIGVLTSNFTDAIAGTAPSPGIVIIRDEVDRTSPPDSDERIVGFGYLRDVGPGGMPDTYILTRRDQHLPTWNTASAFAETEHLQPTQPIPVDVSDLMTKHLNATLNPTLVRAPALVRAIE